ncbi:hypothetical protein CDCA_CDCA01G0364 [Cyanidium caldarium]|uniref:CCT-alpha n=1 Tax=Cyanidium caldarium TaxID=2771 RepID=A0AAV9IQ22_CYACA|nr:hypothetical protein CDCA_CDCA01G0364 [Cyanidium caldarium]
MTSLSIDGTRTSGSDVRAQNVTACLALANVVRSSLGPVGLDKMLVTEIGDVTVTNDGATILNLLEVTHPAAKVLVDLARQQDEEVGDGTTTVVLLAAELLRRGNDLVKTGVHPTSIIAGYKMAMKEACKYIRDDLSVPVERLGRDCLRNAARTALSSKVLGGEMADAFSNMAVDAVLATKSKRENAFGSGYTYPIKSINVLKCHGKSMRESALLSGYGINATRASRAMPEHVSNAKIACMDVDLRRAKLQMGVQMLVNNPNELNRMQERELDITRDRVQMVLKAGANVILTTKGIDDMALKYISDAGALAIRRVPKADLKRVAKATGATVVVSFADLSGEESFDAGLLGQAAEVTEEHIADTAYTFIRGCKAVKAATVLLRGPSEYMLDEMERSLHDALSIVKRTLESNAVVSGGGAVETGVSVFVENFATALGSREQLAVAEFAEALLVIPKTLAVNAALDATELLASLRTAHYVSQECVDEASALALLERLGGGAAVRREDLRHYGLDLSTVSISGGSRGRLRNNFAAGVLEPAVSKIKSIQLATEAAITILRIDDSIKITEATMPEEPES